MSDILQDARNWLASLPERKAAATKSDGTAQRSRKDRAMSYYCTLDDALRPVPCDDLDAYMEWHSSMPSSSGWYQRKTGLGFQLSRDEVAPGVEVSTVFLAINHDFLGEGEPILWETMVFAKDWDGLYQDRYTSHADAVAGHRRVCRLIASEGLEALTSRILESGT